MVRCALLAFVLILPTVAAQTQNTLYATNFNAPTYANGGLIGQDNWIITGTSVVNPITVANAATNGNVSMTNTGQDVRRLFDGGTVNSGSVFLQATVTVTSAQGTGDYSLHFTDGGTSNFYARTYIRSSGAGFVMALGTSSGAGVNYGTTELSLNTPYTVLARYDFVAGSTTNDTGALFINPTTFDGSGDTPYIAATTIGTDATAIGALALRQGTTTSNITVDNYQAFTVVPVPEPALLLGVGVLGAVALRRRK